MRVLLGERSSGGHALTWTARRQRIGSGSGAAHLIPVSSLVLDSAGRQGVRYVDAEGRVAFAPIKVSEETSDGLWVTGLSGPVNLIVVGQSYVADGQKVRVSAAP